MFALEETTTGERPTHSSMASMARASGHGLKMCVGAYATERSDGQYIHGRSLPRKGSEAGRERSWERTCSGNVLKDSGAIRKSEPRLLNGCIRT